MEGQRKRVLMVYPSGTGLPSADEEVSQVSSMHNVEVVSGPVTERDIRQALRLSSRWDVVWFVVHAYWEPALGESFVRLDGSTVLDQDTIVSLVRSSGCELVVFNTCESIFLGLLVVEQTNSDVVCTISVAPDVMAMRTGVLMARGMQTELTYRDAYRRARPGSNKLFAYLPSLNMVPMQVPPMVVGSPMSRGAEEGYRVLVDQMDDVRGDMAVLRLELERLMGRAVVGGGLGSMSSGLMVVFSLVVGMVMVFVSMFLQRGGLW